MENPTHALARWRVYRPLTERPLVAVGILGTFLLPLLIGVLFGAALDKHHPPQRPDVMAIATAVLALVLFLLVVGTLALARAWKDRTREGGSVTLAAEGLELRSGAHTALVSRASLETAVRVNASSLVLRDRDGRSIDLNFRRDADRETLVAAVLGHIGFAFGEGARAIRFPLRGTMGPESAMVVAFLGTFFPALFVTLLASFALGETSGRPSAAIFGAPALFAIAAGYAAWRGARAHLVIGDDALRRISGFGRTRLVGYDAFDEVRVAAPKRTVELLRDGRVVHRFP